MEGRGSCCCRRGSLAAVTGRKDRKTVSSRWGSWCQGCFFGSKSLVLYYSVTSGLILEMCTLRPDGSRDFPGLCTMRLAAHLSSPPLRDLQGRVPLWAASRMASSIRNEAFVFQNGPYAFPVCKGGAWWGLFFTSSLLFHSCLSPQGVFVGKAPRGSFLSISLFPPHFRRF